VIVDEDGYILTNFHVLRRASRAQVKLWDGRIYDAEPVVVYTAQKDVALLKIRAKPGEKFKAIKFAKDDDLLLGETVLALGNPYGLGGSVSRGILSSKARRPELGNEELDVQDWLQTDAAINPGNSGGPLINLRGELIGLNVAVYREEQGMGVGFAIPVKQAAAALSDFFTPEWTDALWFGAKVKAHPLLVSAVQPGSPADKAGLRIGQAILEVNGKSPRSLVNFNRLITENDSRRVTLTVVENGARRNVEVQLVPFESLVRARLGLTLSKLTPDRASLFQVNPTQGLFVEGVEKNGPADRAQIQKDFLLTGIDGQSTGDLPAVINILATKAPGERAQLSVVMRRRFANGFMQLQPGTATVQVR
jgi:S1-C subfamily serine protease